ncbi:UDP-glycosyltransferase UGT5-like isoform X1 [Homarus americanus]|uniref:UDP-glycosyltransferase UGT5-like isoform X1 n=1 Tax=Homarus americanus TaxID=6706 RepID=UPI001C47F7C5|nr:UDP-glycosyltransferase UGT5-like isoform X1 [Homarus americanus]XP_042235225.1 UDP-glycosyltransferase UGT5-like isoform X1 [Homarus americanus]XP_042235226.1 UDP-glycosyltransferase UGT5-like isoform X1 [Homarus americanus]XP_042235227.1 UDP-glycosyltransferase UGT5-like isoform X1 [Homarus americanus]
MRWWNVAATVVVVMVVVQEVDASNILILAPIGTRSHKIFYMAIAEVLAARNHKVTFVTGYKSSKNTTNIREVFLPDGEMYRNVPNMFTSTQNELFIKLAMDMPKSCANALGSEAIQGIKEEHYDLVMLSVVMTECLYSLIHKLQVPYIHLHPMALTAINSDVAHSVHFSSMVPNVFLNLIYPLSFTERIYNAIYDATFNLFYHLVLFSMMEAECRQMKLCQEDTPLSQIRLNGTLFIINSVEALEIPIRPYTATVVHAGGIHCRPAQPLPQELEDWVAEAGDAGFIFFSLGSVVKASTMPEEYRRVLVEVFASLKQRVLWKWDEETMEDLPANVRLAKWIPQQDILGDPRLRLFITHGGLLSSQEATYHGVPLLGIPVFADQQYNVRQIRMEGWGRFVHWKDLTYDTLRQPILEILQDTKIREVVTRRQAVMKDQPMSPGQWMTYWVEYALRHGGAPHLRSPFATMPWYKMYNVDVWLLVLVVSTLAVILTFFILRAFLHAFICAFPRAVYTRLSTLTKYKKQ